MYVYPGWKITPIVVCNTNVWRHGKRGGGAGACALNCECGWGQCSQLLMQVRRKM